MNEIIEKQIQQSKIASMKNPTILIHSEDFETWVNEIVSTTTIRPILPEGIRYKGIPIKTSKAIERGTIVVYDDIFGNRSALALLLENEQFESCDNCDLPDACADFGCAIKAGVRDFEDGIF